MKPVSLVLTLVIALLMFGCVSHQLFAEEGGNKVFLILCARIGWLPDIHPVVSDEAVVMKNMLEEAGIEVVATSVQGKTFKFGNVHIESEKLADVKIADCKGLILPCMSIDTWSPDSIPPEVVAVVRQVAAEGNPIAAQHRGVVILAQAGVLVGKKYSFYDRDAAKDVSQDPRFDDAIHSGKGIVQDGNIITSSYCPRYSSQNQTVELTRTFIGELQK
jgi:putative intracellular protease/amidase